MSMLCFRLCVLGLRNLFLPEIEFCSSVINGLWFVVNQALAHTNLKLSFRSVIIASNVFLFDTKIQWVFNDHGVIGSNKISHRKRTGSRVLSLQCSNQSTQSFLTALLRSSREPLQEHSLSVWTEAGAWRRKSLTVLLSCLPSSPFFLCSFSFLYPVSHSYSSSSPGICFLFPLLSKHVSWSFFLSPKRLELCPELPIVFFSSLQKLFDICDSIHRGIHFNHELKSIFPIPI